MSESEDRPPRLRVLITYDGTDDSRQLRRRLPVTGPGRPLLRAIAGGSAATGARTGRARPAAGRGVQDPVAPLLAGETADRLAGLARELHQMSDRLREAARRIDDLVQAMVTLEGLADSGPEDLLDSLERLGLGGEELQSSLALLSLLAEGPDEPRDGDPGQEPAAGGAEGDDGSGDAGSGEDR